jgi:hypothetical protein
MVKSKIFVVFCLIAQFSVFGVHIKRPKNGFGVDYQTIFVILN